MSPDDPRFLNLTPREQVNILFHEYGWRLSALADEYDVARTTIYRWTSPNYEARQATYRAAMRKTPEYQETERRYRQSPQGKLAQKMANLRYLNKRDAQRRAA